MAMSLDPRTWSWARGTKMASSRRPSLVVTSTTRPLVCEQTADFGMVCVSERSNDRERCETQGVSFGLSGMIGLVSTHYTAHNY